MSATAVVLASVAVAVSLVCLLFFMLAIRLLTAYGRIEAAEYRHGPARAREGRAEPSSGSFRPHANPWDGGPRL